MRGVVSCDWLALSCMLASDRPKAKLPYKWRIESQSSTAVWGVREYVLDERGAKVATILRQPKSNILDGRRMVIEIANEWLYNSLIINTIETCLDIYPCRVTGMPRFDICYDAELDAHAAEVRDGLVDGSIYKTSTQTGVVWWQQQKDRRIPHQLSWGAPDSTFHWKLYWKWAELYKDGACAKPYIEELWKKFGLKPRKVWRLEVSVSDSPKLVARDGDVEHKLTYQDVIEQRVRLYLDFYVHRFILRRNEGHSNKSRDTRVWIWEEEAIRKSIVYALPEGMRCTDAERRLLRKLYKEYMQRDKSGMMIDVLEQSIGRMLQEPELFAMWRQLSQMSDKETHMRFPLSSQVPADRRNIRQLSIDFDWVKHNTPDPNAVDVAQQREDERVEHITKAFREARPSE